MPGFVGKPFVRIRDLAAREGGSGATVQQFCPVLDGGNHGPCGLVFVNEARHLGGQSPWFLFAFDQSHSMLLESHDACHPIPISLDDPAALRGLWITSRNGSRRLGSAGDLSALCYLLGRTPIP